MNFEKLLPVETDKSLLDLAFRKARERGRMKNLTGNWLQIIRQKEALKLDIVKDTIVPRLQKTLSDFPDTKVLPPFYLRLMELTVDYQEFKKSLGALNWAVKRIQKLHREYVSKIYKTKEKEMIKDLSKQCYGRISSTLKQINPNLIHLEQCRKTMRTYPDIKEMFTVCLYGFPNVGKTTLLNKLTQTRAKTAEYAFTTKSINAGYFTVDSVIIQVLDVPGTLARTGKMNPIELQADLVMKELADVIIYVFDLSEYCGYSVKKQEQLLQNLGQKKTVLIYLSKTDTPEGKPGDDFEHEYYTLDEIKQKLVIIAKASTPEREQ